MVIMVGIIGDLNRVYSSVQSIMFVMVPRVYDNKMEALPNIQETLPKNFVGAP